MERVSDTGESHKTVCAFIMNELGLEYLMLLLLLQAQTEGPPSLYFYCNGRGRHDRAAGVKDWFGIEKVFDRGNSGQGQGEGGIICG